jgi:uncharacterized membrane protein
MDPQKAQVAHCRAITDFNKDWNLLKIGTQYFHSFSKLQEEFGPISDTKIIKYLCAYYTAETPIEGNTITDKKAKAALIEFFNNRIRDIQTSNDFKDNSFYKSQDHTIVKELKDEVKKLTGEAAPSSASTDDTKQKTTKDALLKQFFKGLYLIAFSKEGPIEVSKEFDKMMEDLEDLPFDEKLVRTRELMTSLLEKGSTSKKNTSNSLIAYIKDEKPTNSPKLNSAISVGNQAKVDIIKLITLFQTGDTLHGIDVTKKNSLDRYFDSISVQLPHMVEDILLTYRSFTRFYRARYTNVMIQFNKLMYKFEFEKYPIELMIQLVYIMYNMARYINTDTFSDMYSIFKNNEGLLRFTQKTKSKEQTSVITLIDDYKSHFKTIKDSAVNLSDKDDYAYQLIHMHARQKARNYTKPILQLISGKDIIFSKEAMDTRIGQLKTESDTLVKLEQPRRLAALNTLATAIETFFKDKDDTLYIVYQEVPENLLKEGVQQIKQLGQLQCSMGNITDEFVNILDESEATIPKSIEYAGKRLDTIKEVKQQREKEVLYNLTDKNTFADFGIKVKEPLQLVQSLTQITGTLLNAQYLNHKLKDINKKLKAV